jgi:hypothetical protein
VNRAGFPGGSETERWSPCKIKRNPLDFQLKCGGVAYFKTTPTRLLRSDLELLRIKGDVLLQQAADQLVLAAEDCFTQAAQMAREQGALFWELRATC